MQIGICTRCNRLVGRTFTVGANSGELIGGPQSLRLSERSEPIVLRRREGAHVVVSVTDTEMAPLADVELRVVKDGTIANTDGQGAARLTATPGWIEIEATAAGYAPSRFTTILGSAGATRRAIIVLHRGFAVMGRFVDEHGKAECALLVRVLSYDPGRCSTSNSPRR